MGGAIAILGAIISIQRGLHVPIWVWVAVGIIGLFIAQFLAFHKIASRLIPAEQIEKVLKKLGELRIEGVNMRNGGMKLKTEDEAANWINGVNKWRNKVISEIEKISPAEAQIFHTVDIIKTKHFRNTVNKEHQKYLRVLSDRTENIKKLVQRFTLENLAMRSRIEK